MDVCHEAEKKQKGQEDMTIEFIQRLLFHTEGNGDGAIEVGGAVSPTTRFSRGIWLVLDMFSGTKSAVAGCGFWGFFFCICRYVWASFKTVGFYVTCYIKSRHILCIIINTVNYHLKAS